MKARLIGLAAATVMVTGATPHTVWNTEIETVWNRSTRIMYFANPENPNGSYLLLIDSRVYGNRVLVPWCDNDWELQNKAIKVYQVAEDGRSMKLHLYLCQDYRTNRVTHTYPTYGARWADRAVCGAPVPRVVITIDYRGVPNCTQA